MPDSENQYLLTWVLASSGWNKGNTLYLGKWAVGNVSYSSLVAKGERNRYQCTCFLTGIKSNLGLHETEELAKQVLEKAVKYWVSKIKDNP